MLFLIYKKHTFVDI